MQDFTDDDIQEVQINPDLDAMTLDQQLDYTQGLRLKTARFLAPDDVISQDPKERRELLSVLESIDHQVTARKQYEVDNKNADTNGRVADFLSGLHSLGNTDFHRAATPTMRDVSPEFGEEADITPTEYMLSQESNAGDTSFAEFSKRFKEDNPQYDN